MSYSLFLDDLRDPPGDRQWVIVRSFAAARDVIAERGFPEFVSFDHDLGEEATGHTLAKLLVDIDLDHGTMPENFSFWVHSANPVGAKNIEEFLRGYLGKRLDLAAHRQGLADAQEDRASD